MKINVQDLYPASAIIISFSVLGKLLNTMPISSSAKLGY